MAEVPVKVAVRVRPLVGQEKARNVAQCVQCLAGKNQLILGKDRSFTFDSVLSPAATQIQVYEECVEPLVKSCLEGYNATVFAYGQTGSGKTFTIGGADSAGLLDEEYGVIHRAIKQLFQIIEENRHKTEFVLSVSYIEIYMEELRDLLDLETSSKDIHIREDENGNTVVVGATEQPVDSADDVISCLDAGSAGRHTGSTNMNEHSSRSHTIFTLYIEQKPLADSSEQIMPSDVKDQQTEIEYSDFKYSKFHFVDLAGSERAHRTGNVGERFKESVYINSGLLALGNVISALSDTKKKILHVPYRDSKVTRLLKDSLGGNASTVMITCLSPCAVDFAENLNSLKYATRARNIRNKPVVNRDPQNARLAEMQNEIQALREELQRRRGSSFGSTCTTEDREHVKALEDEVKRCRSTCDSYKQLVSEAGAQLKSMHRAGVMSNQQTNSYERWVRTVEQITSRPIWTPNSARDQHVQLAEQLRKEINKYKEDLASDEEIFAEKAKEIEALKDHVRILEEEKSELNQQVQETMVRLKKYEDQLFQQQLQLNQHYSVSTQNRKEDRLVLSSPQTQLQTRKLRAQTAPVDDSEPQGEGGRGLYSSPPMFAVDRVIRDFRARSQLLVSQHEEEDEVICLLSDSSESDGEEEDAPDRQLGRTWSLKKGTTRRGIPVATNRLQNKTSDKRTTDKTKFALAERKHRKPSSEEEEMKALRSSTHVISKQVKASELRQHEAQQTLRDLTINIRYKEELIKELVKSDKEAKEMKKQYSEKIKSMKHEVDKARKELEETRKALEAVETNEVAEKHKVETEYKKKLHSVETKLQVLKRKQKDNERIGAMHEEREKKVQEMEHHIDRMRNQQDQLHKRLKEESDRKIKMEKEMQKHLQKIKEMEGQMTQQQKVLKRKTEEVVAAQRKLRSVGRAGSEENENDEQSKMEERRQWLDGEVEKIIKRKQAVEALEEELQRREAIVSNKEALLAEKSGLEMKKLRSSQILSKDILRLSSQIGAVEQQLKQRGGNTKQEEIHTLERSKEELSKQRELLEQKLQEGSLLDPKEERRLIELDEGIEALDAAIEYKTETITDKELELSNDGNLLLDRDRATLTSKLKSLAPGETTVLLTKYFEKVVQLRDNERQLQLSCSDLEVRVNEQERIIGELGRSLQQAQLKADRRLTEQQKGAEQKIQFLINKLRDAESSALPESRTGELEHRIQQLEKDLYYYKKTSRDLKKKLREKMAVAGASMDSDVVGVSGSDMEIYSARATGGTGDETGRNSGTEMTKKKHALIDKALGPPSQASTPVRITRKDLRQLSAQEVSTRRSHTSASTSGPGPARSSVCSLPEVVAPDPSAKSSGVQDSLGDSVQDSIELGRNPWT